MSNYTYSLLIRPRFWAHPCYMLHYREGRPTHVTQSWKVGHTRCTIAPKCALICEMDLSPIGVPHHKELQDFQSSMKQDHRGI